MHASSTRQSFSAITLLAILISSTSCASAPPPVVSGDTYCIRAAYIQATKDQADELLSNEAKWRSLVEQIADHNDTYKAAGCVDVGQPTKDPVQK